MFNFFSDSSTIINLLDLDQSTSSNQTPSYQDQLNEKLAINAIQKSLMLCETVVKGPSSPTVATPPSYNATTVINFSFCPKSNAEMGGH